MFCNELEWAAISDWSQTLGAQEITETAQTANFPSYVRVTTFFISVHLTAFQPTHFVSC
jgi:hypothetical protein